MKAIQEAVRAFLEAETGIYTVCDRTEVRGEYPMLAVSVTEKSTLLLAGGKQAQHTYEVTLRAASDREREGNTALLSGLTALLLGGIPMVRSGERRILHPLNIRTDEDKLTFVLEICVAVEALSAEGEQAAEPMQTLHFGV